jgi:hypothetical protein
MPVLPPVAKVVRIDFHATYGSDTNVSNRLFFQYAGALSAADAQTWLNSIVTDWLADWVTNLVTAYQHTSAALTDLTSSTAAQVFNSTSQTGINAVQGVSAGTAAVVRHKIARRYRGGHPRSYFTGFGIANQVTPNTWSAGFITSFTGFFNTFTGHVATHAPVAVGAVTFVNVSYFSGFTNHTFPSGRIKPVPTLRVTPIVDPVLSITVNPKLASQRRRDLQST